MKPKQSIAVFFSILLILALTLSFSCSSAPTTITAPTQAVPSSSAAPAPAASSASSQVIKLRFAVFQPATALLSQTQQEYANEIQKRTNGLVQITVVMGGALLGAPDMLMGVKNGIADMGTSLPVYNPGNFPFSRIAELPIPADDEWVTSKAMNDFLLKYQTKEWNDVHLLLGFGYSINALEMGKAPINKLEDWKGKSTRTASPEFITALGGTVKDLAMADAYDAISKGVLDGLVTNCETLQSWKLADVCKYTTMIGGTLPGAVWYDVMNKDKWNSLPPDIQKTITDVSAEYAGKFGLSYDAAEMGGLKVAKSQGDTISIVTADEMNRWKNVISPVVDSYLKGLASKGYSQQDSNDAWNYFQSRVQYWESQESANNISPVLQQIQSLYAK